MSTSTTNLGLVKPEMTDAANITAMNGNWDAIDTNIQNSITHIASTNNPHGVTKSQVGLGNVDNTSDVNKPISTAVRNALNSKLTLTNISNIDNFYSKSLDSIQFGILYTLANISFVIAITIENVVKQIRFNTTDNTVDERYASLSIDGDATWGAFRRLTGEVTTNSVQTFTLITDRDYVDYTFGENTNYAQVIVTECTNDVSEDECVITMCDVPHNKIWFAKPQGITSTEPLDIKYKVVEY